MSELDIRELLDEPNFIEKPSFMQEDEWYDIDTSDSMLDLDDEMEYIEHTILMNGSEEVPVTGLSCVSGQAGNGKTLTMTLLMSAYLGVKHVGLESIWRRENPKILYIDTEMEKGNTQLVVARLSEMTGRSFTELKEQLVVMRLRDEHNAVARWQKILKSVWEVKPDVVFIDGVIDIIEDFNDNKSSNKIIWKLMAMASYYNIVLWCVLHQNPGTTKMVGHEGSFLERKGAFVITSQCVADDEETGKYHFEIKCVKSRSARPIPLKYHVEMFELPNGMKNVIPVTGLVQDMVIEQHIEHDPMMLTKDEKRSFMVFTITSHDGITTRELRESVKREYNVGATKADAFIGDCMKMGIITRDESKRYYLADWSTEEQIIPY